MSDDPEWMSWKTGTVLWRLKDGRWECATVQGSRGTGETRMVGIRGLLVQAQRLFRLGFRQSRKAGQ
jgi:hypothetical protein